MSKDNEMPEKAELKSLDISKANREKLKQLFPSVFTETKNDDGELVESVDFEKLKAEVGTFSDLFESRRERYGMDWPGKKDCMKLIQKPSIATLKPCREESVNFDETENLFIEGDNLEVLKLLQKSYYGKIKMIYIDPPYNTGKEFIYPDDYSESLDTYLAYAGLIDDKGKKFSTNTTNEGRFHTRWLNMMYPRLYLARNLLRDDGVIFVSIDDSEMRNLKYLCDEVYGEENFVCTLIWNKQHSQQQGLFKKYHEYVLLYAKNEVIQSNIAGGDGIIDAGALKKISRGNPASEFVFPAGVRFEAKDGICIGGTFGESEKVTVVEGELKAKHNKTAEQVTLSAGWTQKEQMIKYFNGEEVYDTKQQRVLEFYFNSAGKLKCRKERSKITPPTLLPEYGMVSEQTAHIANLFGKPVFDNPKPVNMIKDFIEWFVDDGDIVLDYFVGSGTTCESVLKSSKSANFIGIQLPESIDESSESGKNALSLGYKTVSDVGIDRVRRVSNAIVVEDKKQAIENEGDLLKSKGYQPKQDLGFKILKLDKSNFSIWDGSKSEPTEEKIAEQLDTHIDHIDSKASQEDILYELLLKAGFKPTERVEQKEFAGKTVFSIAEGLLLICLEDEITKELIDAVAEAEPMQFICLDRGFKGNDQLKANAVQTFSARNQGRDKAEQIIFRTI